MRSLHGIAAALMVAAMGAMVPFREQRDYGTVRRPKPSIKHNGPVIDTTKEGKRAKRRRIAKGGK
nr:MAG TPA: hypothetical protein [Caudoviricetes sp.]